MWRTKTAVILVVGSFALWPAPAAAQSGIAGQVLDDTGGVLPGVTVEATSPALIGGSRSVVTDGQGRYSLRGLAGGRYLLMAFADGCYFTRYALSSGECR